MQKANFQRVTRLSFKINHSIDIIKKAEQMALKYNDFGFIYT